MGTAGDSGHGDFSFIKLPYTLGTDRFKVKCLSGHDKHRCCQVGEGLQLCVLEVLLQVDKALLFLVC